MEVVVVGAGPAGLSAASAARAAGATVRLLDASDQTGGQYWRHLPDSRPARNEQVLHHGWRDYVQLREQLEQDPQVQIDLGAHVWAIESSPEGVHLNVVHGDPDGSGRRPERITPDGLVLATGAHDRALPVPGWTLPGVFTAGAAQALAKGERVAIGERVVVAGSGPFLLPVSVALGQVGARVVAVLEAARPGRLVRSWLQRPAEFLHLTGKAHEFAGYVWHFVRNRVHYRVGQAVVEIHGTDAVEGVTVAKLDDNWRPIAGTERTVECDAVCLGHGFVPRLELAIAAGCRIGPNRFVEVDQNQQTNVPGVYAAGEITGIGGADLAQAEGHIAGWMAAGGVPADASTKRALRLRGLHRSFASRIERAHRIGSSWSGWLRDETLVCRCEEVSYQTLREVADATESSGYRSFKLTTRAGLGACQGRVCGRSVENLVADRLDVDLGERFDRRPIALPIRLADLAAMGDTFTSKTPPRKDTTS